MSSKIVKFTRYVNLVPVEQRKIDGFINATAMCIAHGKDISDWLKTDDTWELVNALADDLQIKPKNRKSGNSVYTRVSATYPTLVVVKRGSPENGGGTWLHPDLALQVAQWCNKPFAIQVSRWIREWLTNPQESAVSSPHIEQEFIAWQQRHDIRIYLKDILRPQLMEATVGWCRANNAHAFKMCQNVHDQINKRVQGARSRDIKVLGGLPLASLVRDYFDAQPLVIYSAINKLATNAIVDKGMQPVDAVNYACDNFLGKAYVPSLVPIQENVHSQGQRLKTIRRQKRLSSGVQLELDFGQDIA